MWVNLDKYLLYKTIFKTTMTIIMFNLWNIKQF